MIAPDPRLKTRSTSIKHIDDDIRTLAQNMFDTMYAARGIGLAAVQVGVLKRMLVADVNWREEVGPGEQYVLINPEIVSTDEKIHSYKEGCLSFPEQYADVSRPETVRIRYMDLDGKVLEEDFDGLLATCIQHEIDHLNGVVFVDHVSSLKRDMIMRRLKKMKKLGHFDPHDHSQCDHEHHVHGEDCNHS